MFDSSKEKRWVITFGILLMLITTVPYYIAYRHSINQIFSGFLLGVQDGNSYIAKMLSGAAGGWLFTSPYSTYSQRGFVAFLPYILMGKLSSTPAQHDQLVFIFHFYRIVSGILLTIVTYQFSSIFLKTVFLRKCATLIAILGGGLGWVTLLGFPDLLQGRTPLEFYSPETFGFLSILGLPHLLLARVFLLLGFIFFLKNGGIKRYRLAAGFCWLMIGFFQPLTIVTGWAVLGCYILFIVFRDVLRSRTIKFDLVIRRPEIKAAMTMVLISSPWVIYNLVSFTSDPYLSGWSSQNLVLSPPIWDYLFSFSIVLPLFLIGIWRLIFKSGEPSLAIPVIWSLLFPILAYAPINLQRRLPDGIWLALTITALSIFDKKKNLLWSKLLLIFSLITPMIILAGSIQTGLYPSTPVYRPVNEITTIEELAKIAPKGSTILASYDSSNVIPAWAPFKVLAGLGPESINLPLVSGEVKEFFGGSLSVKEQIEFLDKYSINFIFYGPLEKAMGNWDPVGIPYSRKIIERNPYLILQVILDEN